MARRRFQRKENEKDEVALQITPLADILVVVLVFLLKSYASDVEIELSLPKDIRLPAIRADAKAEDGIKIEISETTVNVEGTQVASLRQYLFPSSDLNPEFENSSTSKTLMSALAAQKVQKARSGVPKSERAWIIADRAVPYRTIQTVMASAAVEGYQDFKLAVVKEQ